MRQLLCVFVALVALAPVSRAAGKAGEKAPDFPPGLFIDGHHYSLSDLDGKAVVLFFYEQECPTCRGLIPKRNEVVAQFKDKPVKFIAVAAGDSIADAKAYVRDTKLNMPVFADNLSLMEKRYGETISLKNIYQFRVIGPTGAVEDYRMEPEAIEKVLSHVKWKYKDQGYHAALAQAVNLFEWGQYADGMRALKPYLKSAKKDVAESAVKLHDAVAAEGADWLAKAEAAQQSENVVEAYDLYTKIAAAFAGEELGKKAADPLKKLAGMPAVKDELAARRMYEQLCMGAANARPQQKGQVGEVAASIAKKSPKAPTGEKCAEIAKEFAAVTP
jgi:peroxiredoxin